MLPCGTSLRAKEKIWLIRQSLLLIILRSARNVVAALVRAEDPRPSRLRALACEPGHFILPVSLRDTQSSPAVQESHMDDTSCAACWSVSSEQGDGNIASNHSLARLTSSHAPCSTADRSTGKKQENAGSPMTTEMTDRELRRTSTDLLWGALFVLTRSHACISCLQLFCTRL